VKVPRKSGESTAARTIACSWRMRCGRSCSGTRLNQDPELKKAESFIALSHTTSDSITRLA